MPKVFLIKLEHDAFVRLQREAQLFVKGHRVGRIGENPAGAAGYF